MSRQFYATAVYITDGQAISTNHNGSEYINPDFPENTILCQDELGDWFYQIGMDGWDRELRMHVWPSMKKTKKGIRLFRDHWRYITIAPGSPYSDSIMNVKKTQLR